MESSFNFVAMKKPLIILLLILYSFSSTGMTVQLHYCCGKLKNIELVAIQEQGCGHKHKMGSKSCCETKEITNKEKHDHLTSQIAINLLKIKSEPVTDINFFKEPPAFRKVVSPDSYSTPITYTPIYLLHRVFRI